MVHIKWGQSFLVLQFYVFSALIVVTIHLYVNKWLMLHAVIAKNNLVWSWHRQPLCLLALSNI